MPRYGVYLALCLMKEIATFAAECANCGKHFSHPLLGDFSYGEAILCTADGKHFATVSAFEPFAQRVAPLVNSGTIWPVLASLADPIAGQPLKSSVRCPQCGSGKLKSWGSNKTGSTQVPAASFAVASALNDSELVRCVEAAQHEA